MTDKQQIIEEIVDAMTIYCGECYSCQFNGSRNNKVSCTDYLAAEALYNKNYRRVPENAVVLTREEHKQMFKDLIASNKVIEAETRKETAKEILQCLYNRYKNMVKSGTRALPLETMGMPIIKKLAKRHGVEVQS